MDAVLKRRTVAFLAALSAALLAGCLPNPTWLPDSSGFVYTGGPHKDRLIHYDLKEGKPRVLVEKGAGPAWPAVSADAKRIAVALRHDDGTTISLEVIVFDDDGKELHRSRSMEWAKHEAIYLAEETAAQAYWVPDQDKLLLASDGEAGFYDLKKGVVKLDANVATFGDTPFRPDGKGFLARTKEGEYLFIDWDGKRKKVEAKTPGLFEKASLPGDEDGARRGVLAWPVMHASRWDGSVAEASWDGVRLRVDADNLTATLTDVKPLVTADKKVVQQQVRLAGGGVIRAVELKPRFGKKDDRSDDFRYGSYRVEVQKAGANVPKVLTAEVGVFMISPSPDGKRVVVRCARSPNAVFAGKANEDLLFVIDGNGDVTATIDPAKE